MVLATDSAMRALLAISRLLLLDAEGRDIARGSLSCSQALTEHSTCTSTHGRRTSPRHIAPGDACDIPDSESPREHPARVDCCSLRRERLGTSKAFFLLEVECLDLRAPAGAPIGVAVKNSIPDSAAFTPTHKSVRTSTAHRNGACDPLGHRHHSGVTPKCVALTRADATATVMTSSK